MDNTTIGLLGGGHLGRMIVEAGHRLGVRVAVLDPEGSMSPAGQLSELAIEGSYLDKAKIKELATIADVITVETEHVNNNALDDIERTGSIVHPSSNTIRVLSDKYEQKRFLSRLQLPHTEYLLINATEDDLREAGNILGFPYYVKRRDLGFNGTGNMIVRDGNSSIAEVLEWMTDSDQLYAEKLVTYEKQLSILVCVSQGKQLSYYPVVEAITNEEGATKIIIAPAQIHPSIAQECASLAKVVLSSLQGQGIYCIEYFMLTDETLLINEIIPRPHLSGNYTVDACNISQFEMHVRALLNLPCPEPIMRVNNAMSVSVIGRSNMEEIRAELREAMKIPNAMIHWHGNSEFRKGKTMAHYTLTGNTIDEIITYADLLRIDSQQHGLVKQSCRICIVVSDLAVIATIQDTLQLLDSYQITYCVKCVSLACSPTRTFELSHFIADRNVQVVIAISSGSNSITTESLLPCLLSSLVPNVPIIAASTGAPSVSLAGTSVATVASASDAVVYALRILASGGNNTDKKLSAALEDRSVRQEQEFLSISSKLDVQGHRAFYGNNSAPVTAKQQQLPAGNGSTLSRGQSLSSMNGSFYGLSVGTAAGAGAGLISSATINGTASSNSSVCDVSDLDNF